MRHEPTLMNVGHTVTINNLAFRSLKCPVCHVEGGESTRAYFKGATRMCYGFDDATGRLCSPLPENTPQADTPLVVEAKE